MPQESTTYKPQKAKPLSYAAKTILLGVEAPEEETRERLGRQRLEARDQKFSIGSAACLTNPYAEFNRLVLEVLSPGYSPVKSRLHLDLQKLQTAIELDRASRKYNHAIYAGLQTRPLQIRPLKPTLTAKKHGKLMKAYGIVVKRMTQEKPSKFPGGLERATELH